MYSVKEPRTYRYIFKNDMHFWMFCLIFCLIITKCRSRVKETYDLNDMHFWIYFVKFFLLIITKYEVKEPRTYYIFLNDYAFLDILSDFSSDYTKFK